MVFERGKNNSRPDARQDSPMSCPRDKQGIAWAVLQAIIARSQRSWPQAAIRFSGHAHARLPLLIASALAGQDAIADLHESDAAHADNEAENCGGVFGRVRASMLR